MASTEDSVYRIEIYQINVALIQTHWMVQTISVHFYTENQFLNPTFCSFTVNITLNEAYSRHLHVCIYCTLYSRGFS